MTVRSVIWRGIELAEFRAVDVRIIGTALTGILNWAYVWYSPSGDENGRHDSHQRRQHTIHRIRRMLHQMQFFSFRGRCRRYAAARADSQPDSQPEPGGLPVAAEDTAQPAAVSCCPRCGRLATMNSRALAVPGRSAGRYAWMTEATGS